MTWLDVAPGVFARRYEQLDLTLGLVVGSERCLVVDTGGDDVQGAEFAEEIRRVTDLPWTVVITHAHFDHYFGTAAFTPCPVWAHERCGAAIRRHAERDRATWARRFRQEGEPDRADRLAAATLAQPTTLFRDRTEVDLGDRTVTLWHLGHGHTDHDVLAHVPDAEVVFAGDLIEHEPGGSFTGESFGTDAHLDVWPATLDGLLGLAPRVVVPGHGDPVDHAFAEQARTTLAELARLRTAVRAGELDAEEALTASPCAADVTRAALVSG